MSDNHEQSQGLTWKMSEKSKSGHSVLHFHRSIRPQNKILLTCFQVKMDHPSTNIIQLARFFIASIVNESSKQSLTVKLWQKCGFHLDRTSLTWVTVLELNNYQFLCTVTGWKNHTFTIPINGQTEGYVDRMPVTYYRFSDQAYRCTIKRWILSPNNGKLE